MIPATRGNCVVMRTTLTNHNERTMNVRIIGNDAYGFRIVNDKANAVVGFAANRSLCMLIAAQRGWTIVR